MGNVIDDVTGPEWVSLGECARRLGVTRGAIYGRVRRGTVETRRRGNKGFLIAWPPPHHDVTGNDDGDGDDNRSDNRDGNVTVVVELRLQVARLEERLAAAEDLLKERAATIAVTERLLSERASTIVDLRKERDVLADELTEARTPWLVRLVEAVRRRSG